MKIKILSLIGVGFALSVGFAAPASAALPGLPSSMPEIATQAPGNAIIQLARRGADDPAGHDANDDRGGDRPRGVSDDPPGHDSDDDRGGDRPRTRSNDDHPSTGDDNGRGRGRGRGRGGRGG
jgi:hypothetical protein